MGFQKGSDIARKAGRVGGTISRYPAHPVGYRALAEQILNTPEEVIDIVVIRRRSLDGTKHWDVKLPIRRPISGKLHR